MGKGTGFVAAVAVALALVGISTMPRNPLGPTPQTPQKDRAQFATSIKPSSKPAIYPACTEIAKRIKPLVPVTSRVDLGVPKSCWESGHGPIGSAVRLPETVRFVIATAPNPTSTHLPLLFDRIVETIQQAAQDDNYSYDSSWFPWDDSPRAYSLLADQLAADDAQHTQENQPGVIVFRRALAEETDESPYGGGLIVFVVAEQPTGGINQPQFASALAWIEDLATLPANPRLDILGPTFSGSLPSLAQALDPKRLTFEGRLPSIRASSGSISSDVEVRWFNKFLGSTSGKSFCPAMESGGGSSFCTAMGSDSLTIDRFLVYLEGQGYRREHVAIVSEDETAFGASAGASQSHPVSPIYLHYPRDIATLRSAYEQQSIFGAAKPAANAPSTSMTLRGDLSEPNSSEHDSVRSYGGQLTSLAQESALFAIVDVLRERRVQFIVLRSTSSLDQMFLSQFFRRAYPGARVVLDGADLMFRRGSQGKTLNGVMMLSTYPLLTREQDWTFSDPDTPNINYRIFGEDVIAGLYIAALELFRDPRRKSDVPAANQASSPWVRLETPGSEEDRPSTWISVIGHHQFWPVALLNTKTLKAAKACATLRGSTGRHDGFPQNKEGTAHKLSLSTELVVLLVLCSIWVVLHLLWCWRGALAPGPRTVSYFTPTRKKKQPVLIALGSLLPAMMSIVIASTTGLFNRVLKGWQGSVLSAWVFLILALCCLSCWKNYSIEPISSPSDQNGGAMNWRKKVGLAGIFVLAIFALFHLSLLCGLTAGNSLPTFLRSIHLFSGVSPLLPQVLLFIGMYLWFWFCLRGLAVFGEGRPMLPSLDVLPTLENLSKTKIMTMFSQKEAQEPVEDAAIPLGKLYLGALVVAAFLTALGLGLALEDVALRTLGERVFGIMMFCWLSFCMAVVLADAFQLWLTWTRLRRLLVGLDCLPLRRTLSAMKGLSWSSVWTMGGNVLEERYRMMSRQFESLKHMQNLLAARAPEGVGEAKRILELKGAMDGCRGKQLAFIKWYANLSDQPISGVAPLCEFQSELASTVGVVFKTVLVPAWQSETESLLSEQPGNKADSRPATSEPYVSAAEEFVLLCYLSFIQNVLGRVRTIVLGSLFLFVATTLAVSSYPFDPLPVLGGMFLVVFVIVGVTVTIVYGGMHRDATLSRITKTEPGELGGEFWLHVITFGVGPLLGLLTTLFPSITEFVFTWLEPGTQALK